MQFRNTTNHPIEGVMPATADAPAGVGFMQDSPFARHLESIGSILVLDREATPQVTVTPAMVSKLKLENDTLKRQIELGKIEVANLKKELAETQAVREEIVTLKAAQKGPVQGTKADKAAVAALQAENDLLRATALKDADTLKEHAELIAALESDISKLTAPQS